MIVNGLPYTNSWFFSHWKLLLQLRGQFGHNYALPSIRFLNRTISVVPIRLENDGRVWLKCRKAMRRKPLTMARTSRNASKRLRTTKKLRLSNAFWCSFSQFHLEFLSNRRWRGSATVAFLYDKNLKVLRILVIVSCRSELWQFRWL